MAAKTDFRLVKKILIKDNTDDFPGVLGESQLLTTKVYHRIVVRDTLSNGGTVKVRAIFDGDKDLKPFLTEIVPDGVTKLGLTLLTLPGTAKFEFESNTDGMEIDLVSA